MDFKMLLKVMKRTSMVKKGFFDRSSLQHGFMLRYITIDKSHIYALVTNVYP